MTLQELAKQITNDYAPTIENLDAKIVVYDAVMEMHEWTKQQLIEKACKYIKKNVCEHISHNPLYKDYKHEEKMGFQLVVDEQFYIDFKKAMEE